jgi:hypothetical protein
MRNPFLFASLLMVAVAAPILAFAADTNVPHTFRSQRRPNQVDHVVINVKVIGETKFIEKGKTQHDKMGVVRDLEYDEKNLEASSKEPGAGHSVRNYTKASAVVDVGGDEVKPTLRPDRRLIGAEVSLQNTVLFSPRGSLTRSELDLLEVQDNSLLLDQLLPEKAVSINDTWKHSERLLAVLLGLDEVAKTDVQSKLLEVTEKVARFEITGEISGAIHGVPSKVEIKGKYRFDLRTHRIDWLAMIIREDRQASMAADDGVDATSVIQMTIRQVPEPTELSDAALKGLPLNSSPETLQINYESIGGDWTLDHDRRWYVFSNSLGAAVFRMVDRGEVIGQCNVSTLAQRAPEKVVGLEEFQEDVRRALDKNFGQLISASKRVDESQHRILQVVVEGTASDIPIQWTYYHVADTKGHQAAFTFTVEKSLLERFGDADKLMVQSIQFLDPTSESIKKPAPAPAAKPTPVPAEKPTPETTEKPAPEPTAKPTAEPAAKPTAETTEKPASEPATKDTPESKAATESAEKKTSESTEKTTTESTAKPASEPAAKTTSETEAKPTPEAKDEKK